VFTAINIVLFAVLYLSFDQFVTIMTYVTIIAFFVGSFMYLKNLGRLKRNLRKLKKRVYSMSEVLAISAHAKRDIPKIAVLVPARNEGRVIENTIRSLTELDYPKDAYKIYIIVDERELKDNVERFTKDVAQETILDLQKKFSVGFVNCVEVPEWYSGKLGDFSETYAHSTKGRALNYCLEYMSYTGEIDEVEMIGVLDADGRLDPDSLKEIAALRMLNGSKILQGIVLGVSNVKHINIFGLGALLEGAIHHLTFMSARLLSPKKKLLFLAGTNYFFEKDLLVEVGGWDAGSLVEDAELGLRTYVLTGHTADWYSCPEIEQSPANFQTYFKQRERWARGHFQLIPFVAEAKLPIFHKLYLLLKIYANAYSSVWHFGIPMTGWFLMAIGAYALMPLGLQFLMVYLLLASITIFDFYGFTYRSLREYLEPHLGITMTPLHRLKMSLLLYVYTPIHFVVQAVPRLYAPFKYYRAPDKPQIWYKTERTEEVSEIGREIFIAPTPAHA
jgi:cellulose synthase/poly-beta-1,6-N-acetylglucosamine synthase-like glycosyltransferase